MLPQKSWILGFIGILAFSDGGVAKTDATYVTLGSDGIRAARTVTEANTCPAIVVDGKNEAMHVRAPHEVLPLRPTASAKDLSKPSVFDVTVCEKILSPQVKRATINGQPLALPAKDIRRIVVIGDTGCRLKASDNAYQGCNNADAYPFSRIAAAAAKWKPDLVIHVGDYLYRENPCPEGKSGCSASPWGYGWDSWNADFFEPGESLLAAAPWVFARGNHESCTRAGQGWWRLLDPRPLTKGRDCIDPAKDAEGDYGDVYAVPLGGGAQVAVLDLSHMGEKDIPADDPRFQQYDASYRDLSDLAARAKFTFVVDHYPFLGIAGVKGKSDQFNTGYASLRSTFGRDGRPLLPGGVDTLLAGHVHLWEQVGFAGAAPSQFIAGFSGTQEDVAALPETLPEGISPLPGVPVDTFNSWVDAFGYMTLEKTAPRHWDVKVWGLDGTVERRCHIDGRRSTCDSRGNTARKRQ